MSEPADHCHTTTDATDARDATTKTTDVTTWMDCQDFKDLLAMNRKWVTGLVDAPKNVPGAKIPPRKDVTKHEPKLNDLGFLTHRSYEGKEWKSGGAGKEDEFLCVYKQRACVEGLMEEKRAYALFERLKDDKNIFILVSKSFGEDSKQNFEGVEAMRLAPFDENGALMADAIKGKDDFDIEMLSMMGMKATQEVGGYVKMEFTENPPIASVEAVKKVKDLMFKKVGIMDGDGKDFEKRKKMVHPDSAQMLSTMLFSFIGSLPIQFDVKEFFGGDGKSLSHQNKLSTLPGVASVSVMDASWGRDDYLWGKLVEALS